jgi:hypothetical protein
MWECPLKETSINFAVPFPDYSNKQPLDISDAPGVFRVNKVS